MKKKCTNINCIYYTINILNNPNIIPIIDWSHVFARSNGSIANCHESFFKILSEFENKCKRQLDYFHGGSVKYENGNEKKHISAKFLAPSMPSLLKVLNNKGYNNFTLIIESPDSINDVNWLKNMG